MIKVTQRAIMNTEMKNRKPQQKIKDKEKPNGNFRTEKYNKQNK